MTPTGSNTPPLESDAIEALIEMVGMDDSEFLVELIDTFLTDSSAIVASMPSAWAVDDRETVMRAAHSLKSTAATFQAMHLSQLAGDLESEMRGDDTGMDIAAQIELMAMEHVRVKEALILERAKIM